MKKINPFKKLYYDSIWKIEIGSERSMTKAERRGILIIWITVALIIGYVAFVMLIQPIGMHIFGLQPQEPPISVHLMKNYSLTSVNIYESALYDSDEVLLHKYDNDDSIYFIVALKDYSYTKMSAFVGTDEVELKHLDGNQYFMKFIKNKDETVRYNIRLEKPDGSFDEYTFAYDSK